jgi:hypothetical protein
MNDQNWPSVAEGHELVDVCDMTNSGYSSREFDREVLGKAAGQIGWAREMLCHDPVLAGIHIHALEVFRHAYADDKGNLSHSTGRIQDIKRMYYNIANKMKTVQNSMSEEDELLVISDYGMENEISDTPSANFGTHSFRAFAGTTINDPLPDSVFELYNWVERHVEDAEEEEAMQMPKQRLRKLGYID